MSKNTDADVAFIEALAQIFRASDLTEMEVEREWGDDDELKIRFSRSPAEVAVPMVAQAPVAAAAPAPAAAAAPSPAAAPEPDLTGAVTSPMVGTAYLAPEPEAPPFVRAGDKVAEGDTLLIIEAMKTMTQSPAPRAGIVRQILVANGEPVEYGAPL
ncbi:MAG: acetyl-CoA carboxylase biotin carboxyl carrier protein, partial [Pseudomonadota bacterium]